MNVMMDAIVNGKGYGEVASTVLKRTMDIGAMRPWISNDGKAYITAYNGGKRDDIKSYKAIQVNAATLLKDEWEELDKTVLQESMSRLVGIQDLISNGLTYDLGNALGTTVLAWQDVQGELKSVMSMDGITRAQSNKPVFRENFLPIPIIHADYEINLRELEASRKLSNPLDATNAQLATRAVSDQLESLLFTDTTYSWGRKDDRNRNTIYSYINFPDRNNVTSVNGVWTGSTKTADQIITDVLNLKQASINAKHYGPWMLYIPTAYETVIDRDYNSTTPGTTIRERILKIGGINGVKVVDKLPAGSAVLVQMTSDVVRLIRGMPIQNVEWKGEGNFVTQYKVMTIQVPQIRSDANGKSGICLLA